MPISNSETLYVEFKLENKGVGGSVKRKVLQRYQCYFQIYPIIPCDFLFKFWYDSNLHLLSWLIARFLS